MLNTIGQPNGEIKDVPNEWRNLNWKTIDRYVFKIQRRIYQASLHGDRRKVRKLQKVLLSSRAAKLQAVRRITQENQGKKTAGVDGVKNLKPAERMELVNELKLNGKSSPIRRVLIPKPGKSEKRILGIPTMRDRALQALCKLAMEPEWEAHFERNSYGFRPGRSPHDAIDAIFSSIKQKAKFVLDGDIEKCFDMINHQELIKTINTFPSLRRQILAFLKSGILDGNKLLFPSEGTPQGGVISPLLANIALHGIETVITTKWKDATVVRYADDFVVLHFQKEVILKIKEEIESLLGKYHLRFKESKTRICHTSTGFDFLGFNIRQYQVGKYKAAHNSNGENLGFKTLIKPSKKAVKEHLNKIGKIIDQHKNVSQEELIKKLNPIMFGWCNYYKHAVSKQVFSYCDFVVFEMLRAWALKKTKSHKGGKYTMRKYWRNGWSFETHDGIKLMNHSSIKIKRHVKVQGTRSPFDGDQIYWGQRLREYIPIRVRVQKLLKTQFGKCSECGTNFRHGDLIEVDHIVPKSLGGLDRYDNLQLLHKHCHDVKTRRDAENLATSGDKSRVESRTGTCQQVNVNQNLESDFKILDNF